MRPTRTHLLISLFALAAVATIGLAGHLHLGPADAAAGPSKEDAWFGVTLQDLTPDLRDALNIDRRVRGALVVEVRPGSPADDAGLMEHDILTEVNNRRVQDVDEAVKAVRALDPGEKVLVVVERGGKRRGMAVIPGTRSEASRSARAYDDEVHEYYVQRDGSRRAPRAPKAPKAPKAPHVWITDDDDVKVKRFEDEDGNVVIIERHGDSDEHGEFHWNAKDIWVDDDDEGRVVILNDDGERHEIRVERDGDDARVLVFEGDDGKTVVMRHERGEDGEHHILLPDIEKGEDGEIIIRSPKSSTKRRIKLHSADGDVKVHRYDHGGSRGFLGVSTMGLNSQLADYFGVDEDEGVLVERVVEDSGAEDAGIRAGDVIISVGGKNVGSPDDLRRVIRDHEPGETVEIELLRKGSRKTVEVVLGEASDRGAMIDLDEMLYGLNIPDIDLKGLEALEDLDFDFDFDFDEPEMDIRIHGLEDVDWHELEMDLKEEGGRLKEHLERMREHLEDMKIQIEVEKNQSRHEDDVRHELERQLHHELQMEQARAVREAERMKSEAERMKSEAVRAVREADRARREADGVRREADGVRREAVRLSREEGRLRLIEAIPGILQEA